MSRRRFGETLLRYACMAWLPAVGLAAWAPPAAAAERLVNAVVAAIDGRPITLHEFDVFKKRRGPLLTPEQRASEESLLDTMVMTNILEAEFEAQGIYPPDDEVERYIDQIIPRAGSSREEILASLKELGLDWSDYFQRMREEVQRFELINREIRSRVNVTPEEIKVHWKNSPEYTLPERIECAHIFIPFPRGATDADLAEVRAFAEEVCEEARGGGSSFAKAAKEYSKAPSAAAGGSLGVFRRGSMSALYESLLAPLEPGEVADPAEDGSGIHIVKLVEILPPDRVPLEDVSDEIREALYEESLGARYKRWVQEDLRERHHVSVHLNELAQLTSE